MLERIRIQGFKSLRDAHAGAGAPGGVVRPNAAGKSNLREALPLLSRLEREEYASRRRSFLFGRERFQKLGQTNQCPCMAPNRQG